MDKSYLEIADIFAGARRKWPQCGGTIAEIVRELTVHFMDRDPSFNATLFLSACDLKPEDAAKVVGGNEKP